MILLSVDYGDVRTGLAVCDKNEILASPVCVIKDCDRDSLIGKILAIAEERRAEAFVVGLPKETRNKLLSAYRKIWMAPRASVRRPAGNLPGNLPPVPARTSRSMTSA